MTERHLCDEYTEACFRATYEQPVPHDYEQCKQCEGWFDELCLGDVCEDCAVHCDDCCDKMHPDMLEDSLTHKGEKVCEICIELQREDLACEL